MMIKYPVGDSHVHTDHSVDAKGSLREICQAAFERGLYEVTITNHYEIMPSRKERMGHFRFGEERVEANSDSVKRLIEETRQIGEEFFPAGLQVLCGLEIGWDKSLYDRLAKELAGWDLDFVIGSVHDVDGNSILEREFAPSYFAEHPIEHWIEGYYRKAEEIAEAELFNVIGHLDVYKRYGIASYGDKIRTAHEPLIESLFSKMIEHGLALEINTSGIRHGIGEYYPSMAILNAARRAGVSVATIGSDAHAPEQIGLDFETALPLIHELLPCGLEEGYDL
jgi:histidinol-phosphatase (PHP family)